METFERKETKYLLDPLRYRAFRSSVDDHLAPAEFPEGAVTSIYYDTPDDTLVNRSIRGGDYKEKLRVRSYGRAGADDEPVFVEIKKKYRGITYKRRVSCSLAAAEAFLDGGGYAQAIARWPLADPTAQMRAESPAARQVAAEVAWMRDHYPQLQPRMRIRVRRLSFTSTTNPELRITLDEDVQWARISAPLVSRDRALFPGGERILEVKCGGAYPRWLVDALNECGARPQSVSKYGRAYEAAGRLPLRAGKREGASDARRAG